MSTKRETWRKIRSKRDARRIQCSDCGSPAASCNTVHWHTGNTAGVSFFYYCAADTAKRQQNGNRP